MTTAKNKRKFSPALASSWNDRVAPWFRRHYGASLLLAAVVALLLRLIVGGQLSDTKTVVSPLEVTDMATYRSLALAIRQGHWPEVFDYQPFYYTIFLPFAYLFSPTGGPWPVILLQSLVGAAAVWLTGAATGRIFGRKAGLLAALLLAFSRFHIFYTPYLLLEVWFSFWCALVLYCTLRIFGARKSAWLWHALLGLAASGALLTRGNALLWLPGIVLLIIWHERHHWRRLALHLLLFLVCFLLPITPYSVHNSRSTGHLAGASVAGGKVLVLGNSPEAPAGGLEYPRTYYHWCRDAERGRMSVPAHILQWFRENPLAFLELNFRKLLLFWDAREIPNNISYEVQGKESLFLQCPLLLPWSILGTLGLAGMFYACRLGKRRHLALFWMMLAFWGATSAFYILARFRIGFLPLLCCAGAGAITIWSRRLCSAKTIKRQPRFILPCFALFLACYVVNFAYPSYQDLVEPAFQRRINPDGINLEFPRNYVIYDHGPLAAGNSFIEVPPQGLILTKRFHLPEEFRERLANEGVDRVVRQRLMLRIHTLQRGIPAAVPNYNGTPLSVTPTIQSTRGVQWLCFDFESPLPSEGTQAIFSIDLGPSPEVRNFSIALDDLRNYGRTSIRIPGIDEEVVPSEAVVEWEIPRRQPTPQSLQ
ncbi:MAG: glycosyltransferase family 39 protein [Victivallales bacterium]|nr:glycosyltransferase family 39 protein [Victivallales bacterium]